MRFNRAIPYIIEKINDPKLYNNNGSLVYALGEMDSISYFLDIIRMICEQDYEARLMGYNIVYNLAGLISIATANEAIYILKTYQTELTKIIDKHETNTQLDFVECTLELLEEAIQQKSLS